MSGEMCETKGGRFERRRLRAGISTFVSTSLGGERRCLSRVRDWRSEESVSGAHGPLGGEAFESLCETPSCALRDALPGAFELLKALARFARN
jgi:hypothetical protein